MASCARVWTVGEAWWLARSPGTAGACAATRQCSMLVTRSATVHVQGVRPPSLHRDCRRTRVDDARARNMKRWTKAAVVHPAAQRAVEEAVDDVGAAVGGVTQLGSFVDLTGLAVATSKLSNRFAREVQPSGGTVRGAVARSVGSRRGALTTLHGCARRQNNDGGGVQHDRVKLALDFSNLRASLERSVQDDVGMYVPVACVMFAALVSSRWVLHRPSVCHQLSPAWRLAGGLCGPVLPGTCCGAHTHTLWLWMVYSVDERKTAGSAYWTHSPRAAMEECGWTVRSPAYHAAWRSCVCLTCTMAMPRSTTRLLGSGWCRK